MASWSDNTYYHTQTVIMHVNGETSPKRIVLGNSGDVGVNRVIFKFPQSEFGSNLFTNYDYELHYYNTSERQGAYNPSSASSLSPGTESGDRTITWEIEDSITTKPGTIYELQMVLVERNESGGSTSQKERWISNIIYGQLNNTLWCDDLRVALEGDPPTIADSASTVLMKPNLITNITSDYRSLVCNDIELGNTQEKFIRRLVVQNAALDGEAMYAVFMSEDALFIYQMNNALGGTNQSILIHPNLLKARASFNFCVIYTNGNLPDSSNYKGWVSTPITLFVRHGFLGGADVLDDNNFVTRYGEYVYTPDDTIINVTR